MKLQDLIDATHAQVNGITEFSKNYVLHVEEFDSKLSFKTSRVSLIFLIAFFFVHKGKIIIHHSLQFVINDILVLKKKSNLIKLSS